MLLSGGLLLLVLAVACKEKRVEEFEKRYRPVPPTVRLGKVHYAEGMSAEEKKADTDAVIRILAQLVQMVDERDLRRLPEMVSTQHGLWVDVKAHRSHVELLREVQKPDGYLQKFFLDSEQLRRFTKDDRSIAVRDVLRHTDTLRADFYMLNDGSCEVDLLPEQYPPYKHHLNQPAFVKEGNQWKILRLF